MRGQSIPAFRGRRPSRLYFWSRGSTCPVRAANDLDVFTRGYSDLPWRAASRRSCRTGRRKPAIRVGRLRGCELLRSFVAVADCGGFHRAAERLNLTGTGEPRIPARRHRWEAAPKVRFAQDSLLEGGGFEPSVPLWRMAPGSASAELRANRGSYLTHRWREHDSNPRSPALTFPKCRHRPDPAAWSGDLCEEPVTFRGSP